MPSEYRTPFGGGDTATGFEPSGRQARPSATLTSSVSRWVWSAFLKALGNPPIRFVLPNGVEVSPVAEPVGSIHIKDLGTLCRLIYHSELEFGDAYSDGRLEVEGDLVRVIETGFGATVSPLADKVLRRARRPRANTLAGSRHNIHRHYDLGNDFYRLWLDERMLYTCAYYPTQDATLEEAQVAKMEHVCRKVGLAPGQRVVEAGCGWGSLALHMARQHGVSVRAFNISAEQIAYAREQARRQGLEDRVEFIEDDYRNVTGRYDAFVSVGMLEHVGTAHYRELGRVIDRCLTPHGRGFLHTIGRNRAIRLNAWLEQRIFPGAYPPTLREMMAILEPYDFSVLDVENLRLHYAKTTAEWLARFERSASKVAAMFDERFTRAWRLYLAGSTAAFLSGTLQLFQLSFARGRDNELPLTRAGLYGRGPGVEG